METLTAQDCHEAYVKLFSRNDAPSCTVRYSGHFKAFNANVRYRRGGPYHFRLSSSWKDVGKEFQQGCVQSLMAKLFTHPIVDDTLLVMYHSFLKNLHIGGDKTSQDDELAQSFHRVAETYFNGFFDACTLQWGTASFRTLGHYSYTTDTITISTLLRGHPELLDLVMYHEMLHKKHKFIAGRQRMTYHSKAFRDEERRFRNFDMLDKELNRLAARHRIRLW